MSLLRRGLAFPSHTVAPTLAHNGTQKVGFGSTSEKSGWFESAFDDLHIRLSTASLRIAPATDRNRERLAKDDRLHKGSSQSQEDEEIIGSYHLGQG